MVFQQKRHPKEALKVEKAFQARGMVWGKAGRPRRAWHVLGRSWSKECEGPRDERSLEASVQALRTQPELTSS